MPRMGLGQINVAVPNTVTVIDDELWEDHTDDGGNIAVNYTQFRQNNALHSQDMTNVKWTKTQSATSGTLFEAPDNSGTANAITGSANNNAKSLAQNVAIGAGKTYSLSVYLKKQNLGFSRLQATDGTNSYFADFNLTTGAVTNESGLISSYIDSIGDSLGGGGWFRCSITFFALAGSDNASDEENTPGTINAFSISSAGSTAANVAIGGTILMYVWGWQLETDIETTPYIETTSSFARVTTTLNDTSDVWDFDGADIMPQTDPESEGIWETGNNLITGFTNGSSHAFSTLTTSTTEITSAIVSSAFAGAASNALTLSIGDVVTVTFNYTKTSGNDLRVLFAVNANGAASAVSNTVNISSSGFQSHDFTITATGTAHLQLGTGNSGHSINFSATDISADIFEITPLDV